MLRRALLVVTCALAGVALAACENENVAACQQYVDRFTQLPCATGIDPGVDCNAFADYPCAIPDYFGCLETTQQCRDNDLFVCTDATDPACAGKTLASCPDELDCSN